MSHYRYSYTSDNNKGWCVLQPNMRCYFTDNRRLECELLIIHDKVANANKIAINDTIACMIFRFINLLTETWQTQMFVRRIASVAEDVGIFAIVSK